MRCAVVRLSIILIFACALSLPETARAFSLKNPEQAGVAINLGSSYDPQPTFRFAQLSLMALYDYEQIMPHPAPEPLRFKLEGSLGLADDSEQHLLASANFFALYYLRNLENGHFRPYVEAGVGVAYGDFQVDGQGLRFNFNPQAGIGAEWQTQGSQRCYGALRAYHISNGNLHRDNRGINAVALQIGIFF
ncbi:MAG: acyloxyacyl hydrolase [Desulfuromonadaceae bacterium]|nr:acyloxyacyl hydrolase [Desulfuromonadaceae bacterium]